MSSYTPIPPQVIKVNDGSYILYALKELEELASRAVWFLSSPLVNFRNAFPSKHHVAVDEFLKAIKNKHLLFKKHIAAYKMVPTPDSFTIYPGLVKNEEAYHILQFLIRLDDSKTRLIQCPWTRDTDLSLMRTSVGVDTFITVQSDAQSDGTKDITEPPVTQTESGAHIVSASGNLFKSVVKHNLIYRYKNRYW